MKFRWALEQVPESARSIGLKDFPRGSCGDSSLLLGAHFVDLGISGFDYICGERGYQSDNTWTSHAWLQRNGCVVDITADQFADAPSAVIVADPSPWHLQFEADEPQPSDFRKWNGVGIELLKPMYPLVKEILGEYSHRESYIQPKEEE